MLKAFNLPTLFVTVTFSEKWSQYEEILRRAGGNSLPSNHPWEAVEYYYERLYQLRKNFWSKPHLTGFGKLLESVVRCEFQLRQAIHSHMLFWTQKSIPEMIARNYIRADVPDPDLEPELYELVMGHQIHTCKPHLCGRSMTDPESRPCRKGFPQPLSEETKYVEGELRYIYRRTCEQDRYVVPYEPRLLLIWGAHINVQYVTSCGLSKYVTK